MRVFTHTHTHTHIERIMAMTTHRESCGHEYAHTHTHTSTTLLCVTQSCGLSHVICSCRHKDAPVEKVVAMQAGAGAGWPRCSALPVKQSCLKGGVATHQRGLRKHGVHYRPACLPACLICQHPCAHVTHGTTTGRMQNIMVLHT